MPTPAQLAANQRNAQKSTGPTSDEGKARSSANSLSHGLCASTIIPEIARPKFDLLVANLKTKYQPPSIIEALLVDKMALHHWNGMNAMQFMTGRANREILQCTVRSDLALII